MVVGLTLRRIMDAESSGFFRSFAADTITVSIKAIYVCSYNANWTLHIRRAIARTTGAIHIGRYWNASIRIVRVTAILCLTLTRKKRLSDTG